MKRLRFKLIFSVYLLIIPSIVEANPSDQPLDLECTLIVSRYDYKARVINNYVPQSKPIGYTLSEEHNELQPIFILADETLEPVSSLGKSAILGRAYRNSQGVTVLQVGFYRAQIKFGNSLDEGVLQHPLLDSWQYTPIFVYEYELNSSSESFSLLSKMERDMYGQVEYDLEEVSHNNSTNIDIVLEGRNATRVTGTTNLPLVDLNCSLRSFNSTASLDYDI